MHFLAPKTPERAFLGAPTPPPNSQYREVQQVFVTPNGPQRETLLNKRVSRCVLLSLPCGRRGRQMIYFNNVIGQLSARVRALEQQLEQQPVVNAEVLHGQSDA